MKRRLIESGLKSRQTVLLIVTATVLVALLWIDNWLLPAYGHMRDMKKAYLQTYTRYQQFSGNLELSDSIEQQFADLVVTDIPAEDSDEIALSDFLKSVEQLARKPQVMLVSMKPLSITEAETTRSYAVRLSVSGKLNQVLEFVSLLSESRYVTGIESFSIRAARGWNTVDCILSVWMVRLTPASSGDSVDRGNADT